MPAKLSLELDSRQLDRIMKKLSPGVFLPPLSTLISTLMSTAEEEAQNRAPGVVAQGIEGVRVTPLLAGVRAVHRGVRAMESGRKPLVAGGRFPPPEAFRHITSDRGEQFAIARAVARRGTKGRFFMKKAKSKALRVLPQLVNRAADEIALAWAKS